MAETNFMSKKKSFLSQKQVSVRQKILLEKKNPSGYKFSLQKQVFVRVSIRETYFGKKKEIYVTEKSFCHRQKFLSEKKASVTETWQ